MKIVKGLFVDSLIVAGAGGITYGAYLFGIQYGFIVGGLFCLAFGLLLARVTDK